MKNLTKKIDNKEKLTEEEIECLLWENKQVYEEAGDDHRWQREMFTVVEVDGRFFAIAWMKGLTENQENDFSEQPYEVGCEKKLETITKQEWRPIEEVKNQEKQLMTIKQLPLIEEHLKDLSTEIDEKVEKAKSLICTEENVKEIKQIRADLNKESKEMEIQRKAIKEQVMRPYNDFENIYKQYVLDKYKSADTDLKQKIDTVEIELKTIKEQEIREYFEEYRQSLNIDFIKFENAKIDVNLSSSKMSLKKQAKEFIDRVNTDLATIMLQEHKDEILVEYKQNGLILNKAIETTLTRIKAIEEEKRKQEEKIVHIEMNEKHEITQESYEQLENVFNKPLEQPKEEIQEGILTLKFTVRGTRTELKRLKEFLENGGYDYE